MTKIYKMKLPLVGVQVGELTPDLARPPMCRRVGGASW
jgi:hypothetical protein